MPPHREDSHENSFPARMRQARIVASNRFQVEEVPVPQLQDEGDLLLRMAACGICSGDLMPWYLEKKVGTVLGHEVVGWAAAVGPAVTHVQPGDLVFVHHHAPCLDCPACARGDHVHCPGWRASHLDPGGMAEWIRVPAGIVRADSFAVNDLAVERAVFIEPLACCLKAFGRLPQVQGMVGVVVGCGVMGLLNVALGLALGAAQMLAVEPDPGRREWASALGAARALSPAEAGPILDRTADFVIIGPGRPDVIQQALAFVRPGGTAVLFTPTPTGVVTSLDLGELYFREVSLVPSYSCGPDDTRQACDLLRQGTLQPERLITQRFPLEAVQQAYETARAGGPALKVLVAGAEVTSSLSEAGFALPASPR